MGYGDVVPVTQAGKVFTILYILFGCAYMAKVVSDIIKVGELPVCACVCGMCEGVNIYSFFCYLLLPFA